MALNFLQEIATSPDQALRMAFQILLLVMSAFFSGSKTALFSLSRLDLQKLRNSRHLRSEKIHELLDEPRRRIISILCGNELVNIASSANMAAILLTFFGEADATLINILIMPPLLLLVGEVTPKTFAVTFPNWMLPVGVMHTVAGLMVDRLHGIPEVGDAFIEEEHRFKVMEADARSVIKVHIGRISEA